MKAILKNTVPLNSSRYSAERKKYASSFFEEYVQAIDSWHKVLQIPVGKELRCDKTLETRSVLRPEITSDAYLLLQHLYTKLAYVQGGVRRVS